jgi:3-methyladenine DNA glycosylase AlkC
MIKVKRIGSKNMAGIPKDVLKQLNTGEIETVNLIEWLAIDQLDLLKNVLSQSKKIAYFKPCETAVKGLKKTTVNTRNEIIGETLLSLTLSNKDTKLFEQLATHTSDFVRCWAAIMVGRNLELNLNEKLNQIERFAIDQHFGVKEIAWLAVRSDISSNLNKSIAILSKWSLSDNENKRRFASEATRPRGVWCAHIETLKQNPEMALPILEPLKSDESLYVRNSVANWINDAGKTQAQWAKDICMKWQKDSKTKETTYIIKRALRNLN